MILPILTQTSNSLRQKSIEIKEITSETEKLVLNMVETMKSSNGVGLAAPQIGSNIRLVVIEYKDTPLIMVNPVIVKKSFAQNISEEGCLSIPGIYGKVKRYTKITVEMLDLNGEKRVLEGKGLLARIMQHEIDHLDGVLFIDKVKKLAKKVNEY